MDALLNIPILGWILELILYVINHLQFLGPQTLQLATPIALGALCGVMCERSGVVNIAIEGLMLTSAFVGFMVAMLVSQAMPDATPSSIFGATPALVIGVIAAVLAGMLVSALHAWLSVSVQANQIISGTAINILALGLTSYLNRLIKPSGSAGLSARNFPSATTRLAEAAAPTFDVPVVVSLCPQPLSKGRASAMVIGKGIQRLIVSDCLTMPSLFAGARRSHGWSVATIYEPCPIGDGIPLASCDAAPPHPDNASLTPAISSLIATRPLPSRSNAGQVPTVALPSAMLTPRTSSLIITMPLPSQSPAQASAPLRTTMTRSSAEAPNSTPSWRHAPCAFAVRSSSTEPCVRCFRDGAEVVDRSAVRAGRLQSMDCVAFLE
jgi:hypothetical protein